MFIEILSIVTILSGQTQAKTQAQEIAAILSAARKATGLDVDKSAWVLKGTCFFRNAEDRFELSFDGGTRFRRAVTGPIQDIVGFDGSRGWCLNWSGIPHVADYGDPIRTEMVAWVASGAWALPKTPLKVNRYELAGNDLKLEVEVVGTKMDATLVLDHKTMLPQSLSYVGDSGKETWEFDRYMNYNPRVFPARITDRMPAQVDRYTVVSGKHEKADPATYSIPKIDPNATQFDTSISPSIDLKCIGGYMFVKPKVDGKVIGWFFLDSGADVLCIDPKVAEKAGMKGLGMETTSGVVSTLQMRIRRSKQFSLGPVSFADPTFLDLDMSPFGKVFGIEIVGVCGYDFLSRGIVDIDPAASKLSIYQRSDPNLPTNLSWTPIQFNGQIPCVQCTFEGGHSGLFTLDTGSGNSVDIFSPTVTKFKMLADRTTQSALTGGAGGNAASRRGKIDYFILCGHRFEHPTVGLQTTSTGIFASKYLAGNVGMAFMAHFRLVMDYQNRRIAFIERAGKTQ